MLASWRVVRDFEVPEEGTGAGVDVVCAVEGRKPARKDLDRRAAALVTTFLEWAEVVLESRGADIWYYCHYMNGDSGQVVTGGVGIRRPGCCCVGCDGAELRGFAAKEEEASGGL